MFICLGICEDLCGWASERWNVRGKLPNAMNENWVVFEIDHYKHFTLMDVLKSGKLIFDFVQVITLYMRVPMVHLVRPWAIRTYGHMVVFSRIPSLANRFSRCNPLESHLLPRFRDQMDVIRSAMKLNFAEIRYVADRYYKQMNVRTVRHTDAKSVARLSIKFEYKNNLAYK